MKMNYGIVGIMGSDNSVTEMKMKGNHQSDLMPLHELMQRVQQKIKVLIPHELYVCSCKHQSKNVANTPQLISKVSWHKQTSTLNRPS